VSATALPRHRAAVAGGAAARSASAERAPAERAPAERAPARPARPPRWRAESYLPFLLASAAHHVAGGFHAGLRRHDLNVLSWRVLASLSDGQGCTVGELCEQCLAKQPTVSKVIDRLEQQRWVRRRRDAGDGRRVVVEITEAGRRKIEPVLVEAEAYDRSILSGYPADELDQLRALLRELIARHRR
jgi:DNA-binding MarR family transcriptional regulator